MTGFFPSPKEGDLSLFRNIVRLELKYQNPVSGDVITSIGTGFCISDLKDSWLFTNKHCIDSRFGTMAAAGWLLIHFAAVFPPVEGSKEISRFICDVPKTKFFSCSTTDLACVSLSHFTPEKTPGRATCNLYFESVMKICFFDNIHTGNSVAFIGYPGSLWDTLNNLPILRTGTISSIPATNYTGDGQAEEPRVLISSMSIGGNSGSPVFYQTQNGLKVIGIMAGHYRLDQSSHWKSDLDLDLTKNANPRTHVGLSYFIRSHEMHNFKSWHEKLLNT